jgi:hypothetical protein
MLRYLLILRAPDAEDIAKFKAARVLYMSICHEQVWSKEEESTRRNSDAAAKYPALHEAIRQIGGYDALWGCIIPNLKESVPPGLRSLSGRMISRLVLWALSRHAAQLVRLPYPDFAGHLLRV